MKDNHRVINKLDGWFDFTSACLFAAWNCLLCVVGKAIMLPAFLSVATDKMRILAFVCKDTHFCAICSLFLCYKVKFYKNSVLF